jgi:16S rRNA (cytosine967-C5)-methyltransferase
VPVSHSRIAAFDVLLAVEREQSYASELLHSQRYQDLSSQDHGLFTELVMGVLRWQSLLDRHIADAAARPLRKLDIEVLTALRLAAYQLLFLDRVPASAAVNESVELVKRSRKRSAIPFANAVLRKLSIVPSESKHDRHAVRGGSVSQLSDSSAHPAWLVERWTRQYGAATAQRICEYDQSVPETSIRLTDHDIERELQQEGIELSPGKLLTSARRVQSGNLTGTAAFREGRVSIQDEASQLVALLVGKGSTILDCCAAPGGKTRVLAERNPDATVIAVDLHPHRARLLRKLVTAGNVQVIAGDVLQLPTNLLFERVLVDAPCSGTGTLAWNPEIKWRLTVEDIADLQARQVAILQAAMRHVSPGGRLVYSTCSLEPEENSQVVEMAMRNDTSFHLVSCREELEKLRSEDEIALTADDMKSLVQGPYLATIPGIHHCDGFFAAILEKDN